MRNRIPAIIIIVAMLCALLASPASAITYYDAIAKDVCLNGGAFMDVNFKADAPIIDGVVEEGEYYEIPFEALKDYYNFAIGPKIPGEDARHDTYMKFAEEQIKIYACWDGTYFYFAIVSGAPQDQYTCPADADSPYLFAYWCTQLGFAAPDATGVDRYEIGIGASDEKIGDSYYYSWGNRHFKDFDSGEDYAAMWDRENETVTYEVKVDIAEVTRQAPEDNCTMRFTYLISQTGSINHNYNDRSDLVQISASYGCATEKNAAQFMLAVFKGLPEDFEVSTHEGEETEGENEFGFYGELDCTDPDIIDEFDILNDMTVNYIAEDNGDMFVRFTATGANPYAGGKKLPEGLDGGKCPYLAIHYRTSSELAQWIGVNYTSPQITDLDPDYVWDTETPIGNDGQWYTAVLDMSYADGWFEFIQNFCFHFFEFTDSDADPTGHYVDVAWMKYYTEYPEFEDEYYGQDLDEDSTAEEETEGEPSDSAESGAQTTEATDSEKPEETKPQSGDDKKDDDDNTVIWIAVAAGAAVIITVVVVVILRKKKQ